ncbi:1-acyl-sn-glycerol-3-phosphate acyltransferase [[Clostridium] ultunense Esp]|uniref:1-acyl-sn-glycerol-3-phosphate acyltransferase n=1 Tax=[Clostridium] ultunense Esp TaxID=1288971 RepID=M1ZG32_9FIRM|nr:lysophospholipid acyltransferase family protein [Schnuerera ultunensis]CCQ92677.1 1-acyl-sn-glycerol-3-phosphate acyltransferase [[Clostridium] ultunense Esp]SHD77112.1 1-acyl-sn-glycerol-3-phosphate acyltransferase [[Clostridium] ultunense Esp]
MYFYKIVRFLAVLIFNILFRIDIEGRGNIPNKGRVVLCSNHISVLDPIVLAIAVPRPISFMAKKELFENKIIAKLIYELGAFPVDRKSSDISAIRSSLKVLKDEKILGIFPEGTRVEKMDLDSAKPGVSLISIKGKSPVVPVYIQSKYKLFSRIVVRIGRPIYLDEYFDKKLSTEEYKSISKDILKSIYSLDNA